MTLQSIKKFLVGEPLSNEQAVQDSLPKWKALAVMSSDALSSTAYATEEILLALMAFGSVALAWSMPVALAIALLLLIIAASYRQTLQAYPGGASAYTVTRENLGANAGLVAGAALLTDYVLTVAVSVAAGAANLDAAFPALQQHRPLICAAVIMAIMMLNLRGVRGSTAALAFPTYFYIFTCLLMVGTGIYRITSGEMPTPAPILHEEFPAISIFLLLRAFSSGCAALTGIESISSGVTSFEEPRSTNARTTLTWMTTLLALFFIGITVLAHVYGIVPRDGDTVVSQLARAIFGHTGLYYIVQLSTALVLFFTANASYSGFPRLASLLARDRYLPRQLASVGDRLVYSNGILGLGFLAILLIFLFHAEVHRLIPLYALGVFLSLALAQAGMVVHHKRSKAFDRRRSLVLALIGTATASVVFLVIVVTKFDQGAWMVLAALPPVIYLFTRIHNHYLAVGRELTLVGGPSPGRLQKMKHTVVVPISGIHRGVIDALRYALSISDDVRACYVELDPEATERVKAEWAKWAHEIPFVVLKSPYRSVVRPLLEYIDDVAQCTHDEVVTVIIPEFVTSKWRYNLLHNQTALLVRTALLFKRGKVVTSVRYHLNT